MRKTTIILSFFLVLCVFATGGLVYVCPPDQTHYATFKGLPLVGETLHIAGQEEVETPADLVLRAQVTCDVGELVRFDASESTVDGIIWQILPKTGDFEVIENGRRAFFSARTPGKSLVMVAGAKDGVPFLKHFEITVLGEPVPPGPKTLGVKISEWLDLVPASDTKADKTKALAEVFRKTAAKPDVKIENLLEATAIANVGVLGEELEAWKPFLEALGNELDQYIASGQLGTREQFQDVWGKIADGLEKAVPG